MSAEQVKISGFGIGESGVLISCLPLDMLLSLSESSFPHLQGPDQRAAGQALEPSGTQHSSGRTNFPVVRKYFTILSTNTVVLVHVGLRTAVLTCKVEILISI